MQGNIAKGSGTYVYIVTLLTLPALASVCTLKHLIH